MPITITQPPVRLVECGGFCRGDGPTGGIIRDRRPVDSCIQSNTDGRTMAWERYECGCRLNTFTCPNCGDQMQVWNDEQYAWQTFQHPENCHRWQP